MFDVNIKKQFFKKLSAPMLAKTLMMVMLILSVSVQAEQDSRSDPGAADTEESPSVQILLQSMATALRELNYHGRFVYERNDGNAGTEMTSYEIVHLVENGHEYERVLQMDKTQKEIVREGKPLDCLQPGELILQGKLPQDLIAKLGALQDSYEFLVSGVTRIAMRDAWQVEIKPRDQYRFGYRFLLDKHNHMLLQAQMLSQENLVLESFHFVQISFTEIKPDLLKPVTSTYESVMAGDCEKKMTHEHGMENQSPWQISLPKGYMFCSYEKQSVGKDSLVYTDGLSTFSVFVNQGFELGSDMNEDSYRQGATLMFSSHKQFANSPYTVTVVGEVPELTARIVVDSLRHKH